jgi:glycosyltransferase involved in cell wall biosynthesis
LKVAFVYIAPDIRGGTERAIAETSKRLEKMGCEVKLFCNRFNKETAIPELVEMDKQVVPHRLSLFGRFRMYYSMKAVRAATLVASKWNPDIILLGAGFLWSKYILKGINTPAVSRVHVPVPIEHSLLNRVYRKFTRLDVIEKQSLVYKPIVCNSKYTQSMILKLEPNAKTEVVYAGVDSAFFTPTWEDEGYVYLNGRFQSYKNQLLAIRALKNSGYKLVLSGYANPRVKEEVRYFELLKKEADNCSNIEFVIDPDKSKIRELYQRSSLVLVTSVGDPFPLVMLEAMACGKPVAGLNSGGIPELIENVGLLFENDPIDLRKKVEILMNDSKLRKELGKKARAVAESFTWERTATQFYEIFKREIEKQRFSN